SVCVDRLVRSTQNFFFFQAEDGIRDKLVTGVQTCALPISPAIGYPFAKQLLARKHPFTALFAYNDISAIGSIWAIREAGLRVPQIGRASCRERVEISVDAGCVKKK